MIYVMSAPCSYLFGFYLIMIHIFCCRIYFHIYMWITHITPPNTGWFIGAARHSLDFLTRMVAEGTEYI